MFCCQYCEHSPFLYNISLKKHLSKHHGDAEQLHELENSLVSIKKFEDLKTEALAQTEHEDSFQVEDIGEPIFTNPDFFFAQ